MTGRSRAYALLAPIILPLVATGCLAPTIPIDTEGLKAHRSDGFVIYGSDDPVFMTELLEACGTIYDELDRFVPASDPPARGSVRVPRRIVVHPTADVFRDRYRMIEDIEHVGGFCGPDGTVVLYRSSDDEETLRTLSHELVHLYLREHFPTFADATILAHGLAYYLGSATLSEGRLRPRPAGAQALRFRAMIRTGRVPDLERLVSLPDSDDPEMLAAAWSLVAYLMEGADEVHRESFLAFCRAVDGGADPAEAFSEHVFRGSAARVEWLTYAEGLYDTWAEAPRDEAFRDAYRSIRQRFDLMEGLARHLPVRLGEVRRTLHRVIRTLEGDDEAGADRLRSARGLLAWADSLLRGVGPLAATLHGVESMALLGDPDAVRKLRRASRELHRLAEETSAVLGATRRLVGSVGLPTSSTPPVDSLPGLSTSREPSSPDLPR